MIFYVYSCSSTQDLARQTGLEGCYVALEQTRGRGKEGRIWYSPPGMGLYMTYAKRLSLPPKKLPAVVYTASVVICQWLEEKGVEAGIKMPNDVVVKGRKIAGVLAETRVKGGKADFLFLGIGLNLNHSREDFPYYLKEKATSLFLETGLRLHPLEAAAELEERLNRAFSRENLLSRDFA